MDRDKGSERRRRRKRRKDVGTFKVQPGPRGIDEERMEAERDNGCESIVHIH